MGDHGMSRTDYAQARKLYGVTQDHGVTRQAEERARNTGKMDPSVDPAINPVRRSLIRLNPYRKQYVVTVGCPMDIETTGDTTASMGGEVDLLMRTTPDIAEEVSAVLPGYDPQFALGIFGDCGDPFVACRPQFEMESRKIVAYLKEMIPQRGGCANHGEDPQYMMFARAYLTETYASKIGLKGYHFVLTDEPYHDHLDRKQLKRIFGDEIFDKELSAMKRDIPTVSEMVQDLKKQTHQFVFVLQSYWYSDTVDLWRQLCGENSVIVIPSTRYQPTLISTVIGLTEGTVSVGEIEPRLRKAGCYSPDLEAQLAAIDIGAQARLRHALPHPVPKKGDIFANKTNPWPIGNALERTDGASASDGAQQVATTESADSENRSGIGGVSRSSDIRYL